MELPSLDKSSRILQRLMVGHASECVIDSHNRILLPIELREFSGIKKTAMFMGKANVLRYGAIKHGIIERFMAKKSDLTLTEQLGIFQFR